MKLTQVIAWFVIKVTIDKIILRNVDVKMGILKVIKVYAKNALINVPNVNNYLLIVYYAMVAIEI